MKKGAASTQKLNHCNAALFYNFATDI